MNSVKKIARFHIASPLLSGLIYAFIWLGIGTLILSLLLFFSSLQESSLPNYAYVIHGFCSLLGGIVAGRRSTRRGWYHGGLTGLAYGLIVLLIGFLSLDQSLNSHNASVLALGLLAGAIGGMTGVNTRQS
ncbi:TIGR04086 family membrane protein [Paenibacillus sp. GCM10012307]|uniref:TIGR04086 family membrane protein n=2 Tax=Paenibacillus roseus TaxID=2798579 RepID=A0A934J462_9BACL|nr:TIGR04086 family membrane protein [Paenibacillus roseus]